ncbi:MAG: AMP-binding protein [Desulfobacterales bacterium]|nr:AMP-binding protein [Desulfobacterales bacterium]
MLKADSNRDISALKERLACATFPSLLLQRMKQTPHRVALRKKDLGIYREVTWQQYGCQVEDFCLGLLDLGLEPGDRVAIMGGPCPEWVYADLATQCAGAISYGIFSTSSPAELKYLMENGGPKFFVAEDQEHVDKVLAVADQISSLRKIIVIDTRAMFMYENSSIMTFSQVQQIGRRRKDLEPDLFNKSAHRAQPDDIATIIYTSGTTGSPKGVMLTHRNIIAGWMGVLVAFPVLLQPQRVVCMLELAHILERANSAYFPLMADFIPHFCDEIESIPETLFEVSPTYLSVPPRFFQKWAAQALSEMEQTSLLKKAVYCFAMAIGRQYVQKKWDQEKSIIWQIGYRLAYWLAFRYILDRFGLAHVSVCSTGAAPVPVETIALWQIWGLRLREGFGLTEAGGVPLMQLEDFPKPGNAGKPLFGYEMKLTEEGELLVGGRAVFLGYWRDEAATNKIKKDGWIHTGDIAKIADDGNVSIVDRLKDVFTTAGGKTLNPSEIEKVHKSSPYISEVVVIGHGRQYPVALIEINFDTVSEWARSRGVAYGSFTSLTQHPQVYELVAGEIEKANRQLSRVEQPKKFRIIPKELDPEDESEPVTSTRKIQREKFYQKFEDLVESMYSDDAASISAELRGLESLSEGGLQGKI